MTLTGTAIQAAVSLTPASFTFGAVTAKSTSTPATFTLTNSGTAALTISRISLGGADANRFNISTKTCGASLAARRELHDQRDVLAAKGRAPPTAATLQVSDNAPGSPQTATLTGTGQ